MVKDAFLHVLPIVPFSNNGIGDILSWVTEVGAIVEGLEDLRYQCLGYKHCMSECVISAYQRSVVDDAVVDGCKGSFACVLGITHLVFVSVVRVVVEEWRDEWICVLCFSYLSQ